MAAAEPWPAVAWQRRHPSWPPRTRTRKTEGFAWTTDTSCSSGRSSRRLRSDLITPSSWRWSRTGAGLDLMTFQDHPYQPGFLDKWTLLTYVAARTSRVRVSHNVLNLPLLWRCRAPARRRRAPPASGLMGDRWGFPPRGSRKPSPTPASSRNARVERPAKTGLSRRDQRGMRRCPGREVAGSSLVAPVENILQIGSFVVSLGAYDRRLRAGSSRANPACDHQPRAGRKSAATGYVSRPFRR
jgi:hypothetical protein